MILNDILINEGTNIDGSETPSVTLKVYYDVIQGIDNEIYKNNYIEIRSREILDYEEKSLIIEYAQYACKVYERLFKMMGIFKPSHIIKMYVISDRSDFLKIHPSLTWTTGITFMNNFIIVKPSLYKGELYKNIILHEMIHSLLWMSYHHNIKLKYEEGFCVLFSTPLDNWLVELKHDQNAYYYDEALAVKEIFEDVGMEKLLEFMSEEWMEKIKEYY